MDWNSEHRHHTTLVADLFESFWKVLFGVAAVMILKTDSTITERMQASQMEVKSRRLELLRPDNRCWDWPIRVPRVNAENMFHQTKNHKIWNRAQKSKALKSYCLLSMNPNFGSLLHPGRVSRAKVRVTITRDSKVASQTWKRTLRHES